jgi:hypothetical protein
VPIPSGVSTVTVTGTPFGIGAGANTSGGGGFSSVRLNGFALANIIIAAGGGAGFLSSVPLSAATLNGIQAGNGQVKITAVNTAPYAPTVTAPPASATVIASAPITFSWLFGDPDPGDFQTGLTSGTRRTARMRGRR